MSAAITNILNALKRQPIWQATFQLVDFLCLRQVLAFHLGFWYFEMTSRDRSQFGRSKSRQVLAQARSLQQF